MTDDRLASAILEALALERELYPADLIDLLRARDAGLPLERTAAVLEQLFTQRRVARLWHRYLLPRDVAAVRATWLGNIAHYGTRLSVSLGGHDTADAARRKLSAWDGWHFNEAGDDNA